MSLGNKRCQGCQGTKGDTGARGQKVPRVPGSKAQKVFLGVVFSQELISDRACLLKKVHLVNHLYLVHSPEVALGPKFFFEFFASK